MTPEERAAAIGAQFPANGIQYTFEAIVYSVTGCVVTGPVVKVDIVAWTGKGAHKLYLPLGDGVFRFVNPPLMPPDGGFDAEGHRTFTRDDLAAAQRIVADAVIACATRNGWTP
jgi:hypothetical protein